ncbi:O-antigen ligase family protein [Dictyobacter aurantiacus]|uniref:O-antigen ligase-related domain-containing protein n=1 Tax=Dictyobacter aurantiacus TaxID=1936993 RepID=A0A401ZJ47_9CHLR|nr:O-antigen ligase family protein [Dictyobacter aurantiacus]GCE06859.1 hypothetical protein KDAU_41880 [Dictyobacter aurantiacus]
MSCCAGWRSSLLTAGRYVSVKWLFCVVGSLPVIGGVLVWLGPLASVVALGMLALGMIAALRLDALLVVLLLALHLYLDWYLGLHLVVPVLAVAYLLLCYLLRSQRHPWMRLRGAGLWSAFLMLTLYPAFRGGSLMLYDAASFYPSDILGALLMYWLGLQVGHDTASLRRFFQLFTLLAVALALHTLFQSVTGTILFASARVDDFLSRTDVAYYQLLDSDTHRAGSFFIDPNWNGAFFAMLSFLPLGLLVSSRRWWQKLCWLLALPLLVLALMCTYSTGAWLAFLCGLGAFLYLVGSLRYRLFVLLMVICALALLVWFFPGQLALQLRHAGGDNELSLRVAAWRTALRVIQAHPWFGVGLGHQAYLLASSAYRVPEQFVSLSHPHDSYLEWAAMAGFPVLVLFMLLLLRASKQAWTNWRRASVYNRPLLGAGLTASITLSINSISINGWTHFALAPMGWLLLGVLASPGLGRPVQHLDREVEYVDA